MENGGNIFLSGDRGQDCNNANTTGGWDIWEVGTSRFNWSNLYNSADAAGAEETDVDGSTYQGASTAHALMYHQHNQQQQNYSLYGGDGSHLHTDPHLVCLNLGKRNYFEDATVVERHVIDASSSVGKRVKADSNNVGSPTRCQVEGCQVALVNAKEYHKRHKVCEMHSKAPSVVVQGSEQRFCQQCSRFHMVREFDESKRSCRRRLAGHNERRRKNSSDSLTRNSSQDKYMSKGRFSYIMSSQAAGRAFSLLSSSNSQLDSWDLSSRSSAALRELIAENRAAMLARQIVFNQNSYPAMDQDLSHSLLQPHHHQQYQLLPDEPYRHLTLDLMQAPTSAFGIVSNAKQQG